MENKFTMKDVTLGFVFKYKGDWMKIYDALQNKEKPDEEIIAQAQEWIEKTGLTFTWLMDPKYPQKYKGQYYKPPFIIFKDKKGNEILDTEMNFTTGKKKSQAQIEKAKAEDEALAEQEDKKEASR